MEVLDKLTVVDLKYKVLLMMNNVQHDGGSYTWERCYGDLSKILECLDAMDQQLTEENK